MQMLRLGPATTEAWIILCRPVLPRSSRKKDSSRHASDTEDLSFEVRASGPWQIPCTSCIPGNPKTTSVSSPVPMPALSTTSSESQSPEYRKLVCLLGTKALRGSSLQSVQSNLACILSLQLIDSLREADDAQAEVPRTDMAPAQQGKGSGFQSPIHAFNKGDNSSWKQHRDPRLQHPESAGMSEPYIYCLHAQH